MFGTDFNASCSCHDVVGWKSKPGRNHSKSRGKLEMKNRLLLSTAMVLASVGFASAQNTPGNSHSGAAHQGAAAEQNEQPQSQQRNAQGGQKQTGAQSGQHETTGQAPSSARDQANEKSVRDQNSAAPSGEHNKSGAQAQQRNEPNQGASHTNRDTNQRTGQQAPNERTGQGSQGRAENQGGNRNTAQQPQNENQGNRNAAQEPQQRTSQSQDGQNRSNINLSSEQRTKIRETMLNGRDVPRVNNVSFALNVGAAVPSNVRIVEVPEPLIELRPEWRSYSYFVVRDEIVIIDSGRHIVAMVPTGSSSARVEERGNARGAMNLDRVQIREVQIELQRQGFEIGEPDGMLGPRTKEALMSFQKQRGFQATGEIDHDTFAALGQGQGRGQSETTGQAPRNAPSSGAGNNAQSNNPRGGNTPQASENPAGNRPGAGEPHTTGQSSGNLNGRQGNTPSTQGEQRRNETPR
jgi:Putative peptidoglycan binding domain/Protein of unknown function (DUF1236)